MSEKTISKIFGTLAIPSYVFIAYILFSIVDVWNGTISAINFFNILVRYL